MVLLTLSLPQLFVFPVSLSFLFNLHLYHTFILKFSDDTTLLSEDDPSIYKYCTDRLMEQCENN